jgi:predicted RNase H-like nuclease (RuvC/YqgF family)
MTWFYFVLSCQCSDCHLIVQEHHNVVRAYVNVTVAPGLAVHLRPVHDERIVGVEAVRREGGVICPASALHA